MKTIVVLSDTHGNTAPLAKLARVLAECNYIIHLGDGAADMRELRRVYPNKTYVLAGNNDFYGGDSELVLDVEERRIFACHGHRYGVRQGTDKLAAAARERLCDIALYGHTHSAEVREEGGMLLINPGSLDRYGRQSYCYLVIHRKKAVATIVDL